VWIGVQIWPPPHGHLCSWFGLEIRSFRGVTIGVQPWPHPRTKKARYAREL